MATPWNNLPKEMALTRSVNSFKSMPDLNLRNSSRNTHVYSSWAAIGESDYLDFQHSKVYEIHLNWT